MERRAGKKFKKNYFPTSQMCLHQIFRAEDEKTNYFENKFLWVILVH
jgi:hypothetical protein